MSNTKKQPRSLAEVMEQLAINRKTAARQKGGQIRGLQQALKRAKKLVRIFDAEIELIKGGASERGLNKKIAQRTRLPYEYVMKNRRAAYKK